MASSVPFSEPGACKRPQGVKSVSLTWVKHARSGDQLVYCGMSGRELEKALLERKKKYGLINRLASHASGRLSGDQFCVYVANRLVIPTLLQDDLSRFASGELRLDFLTKKYIHDHLDYQYLVVNSSKQAYETEERARDGQIFSQKPLLNPT